MASNQAAWLDGKEKKLRVDAAEMPKAGADEVVVKNHAVAVNPVDWKIQDSGAGFIKTWPMVLGCDVAGEVIEVGSNVTHLKKGDRVTAHAISLLTNNPHNGAFQLYTAAPASTTAKLPASLSFPDACVLPLAFDTAAVGLYSPSSAGFLGLPLPSLNPKPCGKAIVVWGGSSSVGALTIQLAVASGVKVITTASAHNFDFCRECGASSVFDYNSPSVVEDVISAVKSCGADFAGLYDSISLPTHSYPSTLPILSQLGGGSLACVLSGPESPPSNVKVGQVMGISELTHELWRDYITPALEKGQLRCLPPPLVVGRGLEAVQQGLEENKKGVSARKVVVEL